MGLWQVGKSVGLMDKYRERNYAVQSTRYWWIVLGRGLGSNLTGCTTLPGGDAARSKGPVSLLYINKIEKILIFFRKISTKCECSSSRADYFAIYYELNKFIANEVENELRFLFPAMRMRCSSTLLQPDACYFYLTF